MRARCSSRSACIFCLPEELRHALAHQCKVTGTVIEQLWQLGYDVLSVKESVRSEQDDVILARAQVEKRIVITHDKDFGELAFRAHLPSGCGIVLFRLSG